MSTSPQDAQAILRRVVGDMLADLAFGLAQAQIDGKAAIAERDMLREETTRLKSEAEELRTENAALKARASE